MVRHYYTLIHIASELQENLGWFITDVFKVDGKVFFQIENSGITELIVCSLEFGFEALYKKKNFNSTSKKIDNMFQILIGQKIEDVELKVNDRLIVISTTLCKIYIMLFSGGKANLIIANLDDIVVDAKHRKGIVIGEHLSYKEPKLSSFQDLLLHNNLKDSLANCDIMLGKYYADEIITSTKPIVKDNLTDDTSIFHIFSNALQLRSNCLNATDYYILENDANEYVLSLVKLKAYNKLVKHCNTISDAVETVLHLRYRKRRFSDLQHRLATVIKRKIHKLQNAIFQMKSDEDADNKQHLNKLFADLLLSQPDVHVKSLDVINVQNWDGKNISIPLDNKLTLFQNAERYYNKVKTARLSSENRKIRLPKYQSDLVECVTLLELISQTESIKELVEVSRRLGMNVNNNKEHTISQESKYRCFELIDGSKLYIGKNAANNDELTMRYAKPNDVWLHARGVSGSHAVLKLKEGEKPIKKVLEQAAQITAYYSQARNAKYTPVVYTRKKYVRKPKGSAVGAVVLDREEVIMVEPKLPDYTIE